MDGGGGVVSGGVGSGSTGAVAWAERVRLNPSSAGLMPYGGIYRKVGFFLPGEYGQS